MCHAEENATADLPVCPDSMNEAALAVASKPSF